MAPNALRLSTWQNLKPKADMLWIVIGIPGYVVVGFITAVWYCVIFDSPATDLTPAAASEVQTNEFEAPTNGEYILIWMFWPLIALIIARYYYVRGVERELLLHNELKGVRPPSIGDIFTGG